MKQGPSAFLRSLASLLILSSSSGCSYLFVTPPKSESPQAWEVRPAKCTSSKVAPGFDTAFGALELVRVAAAAAADDSVYSNPNQPLSREADIALGVGFTALFVSSAIYGFVNTSRCARLHRGERDERREPKEPPGPPETWGASAQEARPTPAPPPTQASDSAASEPPTTPDVPAAPDASPGPDGIPAPESPAPATDSQSF